VYIIHLIAWQALFVCSICVSDTFSYHYVLGLYRIFYSYSIRPNSKICCSVQPYCVNHHCVNEAFVVCMECTETAVRRTLGIYGWDWRVLTVNRRRSCATSMMTSTWPPKTFMTRFVLQNYCIHSHLTSSVCLELIVRCSSKDIVRLTNRSHRFPWVPSSNWYLVGKADGLTLHVKHSEAGLLLLVRPEAIAFGADLYFTPNVYFIFFLSVLRSLRCVGQSAQNFAVIRPRLGFVVLIQNFGALHKKILGAKNMQNLAKFWANAKFGGEYLRNRWRYSRSDKCILYRNSCTVEWKKFGELWSTNHGD